MLVVLILLFFSFYSGYLSSAKALDREMKDQYELIVQVSDGIHVSYSLFVSFFYS